MALKHYLDRRFYPRTQDSWDDKAFREYILGHLSPDMTVLDLGAGAGMVAEMNFRGKVKRMCGLDPDPRVIDNPYLDEAREGFGEKIPWPEASFDLVFADNVLEHLASPERVFAEIARVLKPGGSFLFKTPNRRHYMPLIARFTPLAFHRFVNRLRGRPSEDTFPTHYRANRPRDIDADASHVGLYAVEYRLMEDRPEYLRLTAITYPVGILYERIVNASDALNGFRIVLMGRLVKPTSKRS